MEDFCDWCGEKREVTEEGKAKICWICKAEQGKKRGKEVPAKLQDFEVKTMSTKAYADFMKRTGAKPLIAHVASKE
jgi:hypothetical protein